MRLLAAGFRLPAGCVKGLIYALDDLSMISAFRSSVAKCGRSSAKWAEVFSARYQRVAKKSGKLTVDRGLGAGAGACRAVSRARPGVRYLRSLE